MDNLEIRPAVPGDASAMSALIQRTVRLSNAPDYDQPTIDLICLNFARERVLEKMAERDIFVALLGNEIVGTISLGKGKLHSLFVEPQHQHHGVGVRRAYLEQHATTAGLSVLSLSSSITARPFYERLGYAIQKFEMRQDGSTYLMTKALIR
jgi:putative acetyltransferase